MALNSQPVGGSDPALAPARPVAPVVALDLGNVCVTLDAERCARRLGVASMDVLRATYPELLPLSRQVEVGQLPMRDFVAGANRLLGASFSHAAYEEALCALITGEMPGMRALVEEACALGLSPVFLSDIADFQYDFVRRLLSFAHLVPRAVVSYEVGAGKPAAPMYEAMERDHCGGGIPALYIDDRPDNIAAGRARGWRSYCFGNIAACRAELHAAAAALATR